MIKKYNQFVKGKVNEEFVMAEPKTSPDTTRVRPGTIEKPGQMPTIPTPIRKDRTSPVPAPAKAELEQDSMEEEGGEYMGSQMLQNLADSLGTEVVDNSVEYNGKKVNFYSETEMFHVDKKKFKTVEEVVDYLEASTPSDNDMSLDGEISSGKINPSRESEMDEDDMSQWNKNNPHAPSKEYMDELMDAHDDDDFVENEEEEEEKLESKSYKSTRKFESFKNKKK